MDHESDSTTLHYGLSEVPGIFYADLLGTRSRTDVEPWADLLDRHIAQNAQVKALLNAVHVTLRSRRFTGAPVGVFSDSVFAVLASPLAACEFAVGVFWLSLQFGAVLRGGVDVGTSWATTADYPPPPDAKIVCLPMMGWGITAAVQAQERLQGVPGHRLAPGTHLFAWLEQVDARGIAPDRLMAVAIRRLIAPTSEPWMPAPQLLWMDEGTRDSLAADCGADPIWFSIDELIDNMTTAPLPVPGDARGQEAWDASLAQLRSYAAGLEL